MVVRFVCVIRVPVRARAPLACPVCPAAPPVSFYHGTGMYGEVLWEREAAGSGSLGAVSSESTAGSGRLRDRGC